MYSSAMKSSTEIKLDFDNESLKNHAFLVSLLGPFSMEVFDDDDDDILCQMT